MSSEAVEQEAVEQEAAAQEVAAQEVAAQETAAQETVEQSGRDWGVVGHDHAVAALRHALATGRLSHAYLLSGPPGAGKATLARRLAQILACDAAERPCLECRSCRQIESGESPDVERIAVGGVCDERSHTDHGADNSTRIRICQVRRMERVASLAPFHAPRRVFVVDTVDELQLEAANALLKTLEEPPRGVLLMLLATDVDALLPTIRSRCQLLALRPMPRAELAAALREELELALEEADELAGAARGRYGLALRLHRDPSLRVLEETAIEDVRRLGRAGRNERFDYAARLAGGWQRERESVLATLEVWSAWWREVLTAAAAGSEACSPAEALRALRATRRAREHLLQNTNAQLALEVMMLELPVLLGEGDGRANVPVA